MKVLPVKDISQSPRLPGIGPEHWRWIIGAILCLCLLSLGSRWLMTERLPFVMDELVDTQLGCQVARGVKLYSEIPWERTPLMTYVIGAVAGSGADSFHAAVLARRVMWLGTVLIFLLTYSIARKVYGSYVSAWTILLLCGYTTFLDRSIRVRADLVSTLFSLPALWVLVNPHLSPLLLVSAGLSLGLAVLATQKAVYFVAAFAVALTARHLALFGLTARSLRILALSSLYSIVGFAAAITPFLVWVQLSGRMVPFLDQCFFGAARIGLVADIYGYTWYYFRQTVARNPLLWMLAVAGVVSLFYEGLRERRSSSSLDTIDQRSGPKIALSLWSFTLLVLVTQHHVKFPYLFLNIAPGLALCASHPFDWLVRFMTSGSKFNWRHGLIALLSAVMLLIVPLLGHLSNMRTGLIGIQKSIMDRIDEITDVNDSVFDGIGIAVTRRKATPYNITARWHAEREAGATYDLIGMLRKSQPKVFVENYRISRLQEKERAFLYTHFVQDWANVYVVGAYIMHPGPGPTVQTIDLVSSAEYAVISSDIQNIRINGKAVGKIVLLNAGSHEVVIDGEPRKVLLKYAKSVQIPSPSPRRQANLFPSYADGFFSRK